jgi:hypothetical protein
MSDGETGLPECIAKNAAMGRYYHLPPPELDSSTRRNSRTNRIQKNVKASGVGAKSSKTIPTGGWRNLLEATESDLDVVLPYDSHSEDSHIISPPPAPLSSSHYRVTVAPTRVETLSCSDAAVHLQSIISELGQQPLELSLVTFEAHHVRTAVLCLSSALATHTSSGTFLRAITLDTTYALTGGDGYFALEDIDFARWVDAIFSGLIPPA